MTKGRVRPPAFVLRAMRWLESHGFETYVVGGALRDLYLKRHPTDWDLATSAKPEEVEEIFPKHVSVGKKFGTIEVGTGKSRIQITTYRSESDYRDARHPESVAFIDSIETDLSRRDFTINAMAWNPQKGLVDPFSGQIDIKRGWIRTVGNPWDRFHEDALRILRAARFSSQLGFSIHSRTTVAARDCALGVAHLSKERVGEEVTKLLLGPNPSKGLAWMSKVNLFFSLNLSDPKANQLRALERSAPALAVRLAIFLIHEPDLVQKLRALRKSQAMITEVKKLTNAYHAMREATTPQEKRAVLHGLGQPLVPMFLELWRAFEDKGFRVLARLAKEKIYDLSLDGNDLIAMGLSPGKELGAVIKVLQKQVFKDPSINTRTALRRLSKRILSEEGFVL